MSNTDSLLQQAISASLQQTEASKAMTSEVNQKMGQIDNEVAQAKAKIDSYVVGAREEYGITRQSKNQYGNLTGDCLDFFSKNSHFDIRISLYRTIVTGIDWAERDAEEQEILTAMGCRGAKYFCPSIRVLKMVWSGYDSKLHHSHTIFPSPIVSGSTCVTTGCYAKLLSGDIRGHWLKNVNDEWGCCGEHYKPRAGIYIHSHPYVYSSSGEVLFLWAGTVSGLVSLERESPKWGYFPSLYGDSPFDTKPGG
ncbi:hypothetical protein [Vibrio campbellii]|uniref:Uncharacterized protein n=1 Tax=Vibrio campbellii (strain ATCC BAA-1116) TaxID=2902295 RepID=A7N387_VIBC1|nr:hypothetical protein [Vibrio campbellii]ABU72952.1 hypothetical protein VIBHAR_05045 [Vibrio campbellii ATCC BAA-1116]AGU98836.1 hypothetical protein M892_25975 [Vibrio campbellii ATCC BAA-1116]MBT0121290.1 hypothetical protein [Vibrio campbellii]MBT0136427.1 hypothetical protein [Vibrio campbellii]MBT0141057.1 hypothetical protein [Vibrio campbellii]